MAGMGPPPKPADQQRRPGRGLAAGGLTQLPAEGRQGDPPAWPLPKPVKRERELWARVWATPQAVVWERLGWADVVARYVRQLAVAEQRDAPITILGEVRQLEDRLGLSPMAMLRLRWEIVADEVAGARETGPAPASPGRERLRAVE